MNSNMQSGEAHSKLPEKKAYMIPVHEAFHSYDYKNCTYIVHSLFSGWDSIVPKLQELMVDKMIDEMETEEMSL